MHVATDIARGNSVTTVKKSRAPLHTVQSASGVTTTVTAETTPPFVTVSGFCLPVTTLPQMEFAESVGNAEFPWG
jgi:hypothetical protein